MKKEYKIGLFFLIVLFVFSYFLIKTDSITSILSKKNTYVLKARFDSVVGVFEGSAVRLAGIRIGVVERISLEDNKALVIMFVKKKYKINSNARAIVSSLGIVGEKFIDVVYREEYKKKNPHVLQHNQEIETIHPFDLDALSLKLNSITKKISSLLDTLTELTGSSESDYSIRKIIKNISEISGYLKNEMSSEGRVSKTLDNFNRVSEKLCRTLDSVRKASKGLESILSEDKESLRESLRRSLKEIETISTDLRKIVSGIKDGKGSIGKALKSDKLYSDLEASVESVSSIVKDIEKKKDDLNKMKLSYNAGADYITDDEKARMRLGFAVRSDSFILQAGVKGNVDGNPLYKAVVGRRFSDFELTTGIVDSNLGAGIMYRNKSLPFSLLVEGSDFSREKNPKLNTRINLRLTDNFYISAGYEDFLRKEFRKFMVGITITND